MDNKEQFGMHKYKTFSISRLCMHTAIKYVKESKTHGLWLWCGCEFTGLVVEGLSLDLHGENY